MNFRERFDFSTRAVEAKKILLKYENCVPVIVEKMNNTDIPLIDKQKYLIPKDLTVGQFIYVIRKKIVLREDQAIFIFFNNTLEPSNAIMIDVYNKHKDPDGFLYAIYSGESTFG